MEDNYLDKEEKMMSLWNFGATQFWHLSGRCKKTDFLPDKGNHLF